MMDGMKDPKSKALEELMAYLDQKDGEELGAAVKPQGMGVEVTKIEKLGGEHGEPDGDEMKLEGMSDGESSAGMSEDEMDELIEALQAKLGS